MTLVDGVTVMTGGYPTREQLIGYSGLAVTAPAGVQELGLAADSDRCCGSGGCC